MDICKTQYQLVKVLMQCQYTIGLIMDLVWKKENKEIQGFRLNPTPDVC